MFDRRTFLKTGAACSALAMVGARARLAYAALPDDRRFIVVILRGGLDGLAAVPAHGDPDYAHLRGGLALAKTGAGAPIDLDGTFGLHPSLHHMSEMWAAKELAVFHNVATPYRDRSHFDAQNVLETGGGAPHLLREGWLNRALQPLGLDGGDGALAVASSPPLLLDGEARVASWLPSRMPAADEEYMARVAQLYARDPVFAAALKEALATQATAAAAMHVMKPTPAAMGAGSPNMSDMNATAIMGQPPQAPAGGYDAIAPLMQGAGKILAAENGPRVAVFDISGWDTHFNQGAGDGQLARRLQALDQGLFQLKTALGPAWNKTVVAAASEVRPHRRRQRHGRDRSRHRRHRLRHGRRRARRQRSRRLAGVESVRAQGRPGFAAADRHPRDLQDGARRSSTHLEKGLGGKNLPRERRRHAFAGRHSRLIQSPRGGCDCDARKARMTLSFLMAYRSKQGQVF